MRPNNNTAGEQQIWPVRNYQTSAEVHCTFLGGRTVLLHVDLWRIDQFQQKNSILQKHLAAFASATITAGSATFLTNEVSGSLISTSHRLSANYKFGSNISNRSWDMGLSFFKYVGHDRVKFWIVSYLNANVWNRQERSF